jgi:hypothetical protein
MSCIGLLTEIRLRLKVIVCYEYRRACGGASRNRIIVVFATSQADSTTALCFNCFPTYGTILWFHVVLDVTECICVVL